MDSKLRTRMRVGAGIFLISLLAAQSTVQLLRDFLSFKPEAVGKDRITLYEERFEGLKQVLPPRGVFGYLSERTVQVDPTHLERDGRYCVTRYALAPRIVLDTLDCKQIIGNFHEMQVDDETYREWNMEVLARFNGVAWLLNRNVP